MYGGRPRVSLSLFAVLLVLMAPFASALPSQEDAGQPGDAGGTRDEARSVPTGSHSGTLFAVTDPVDWYRVDAPAGTLTVQRTAGTVELRIHAPDGQTRATAVLGYPVSLASAVGGSWHVEVVSGGRTYGPYGFYVLASPDPAALPDPDPVVVATFDTGTNPFHPCFRTDRTIDEVPGYPATSVPLDLTFADTYRESLTASAAAIAAIEPWTLYHIPGTKLSFYGGSQAKDELVDYYPHGSQASSMIACDDFGMGGNAQLIILNHYYNGWSEFVPMLDWVAAQDHIDVVHLNIQDIPVPLPGPVSRAITDLIDAGKMVVIAAGNGVAGRLVNYPMELSSYNGPPGSLVIGASDNTGYTFYSNLDPHVVADGWGTRAAAPYGYDSTSFSGTSSASPLATGYVTWLLGLLRAEWGHTGEGLLRIPDGQPRPAGGPLADGILTTSELHEVVRATADPTLTLSQYDGTRGITHLPASPVAEAHYAKAGYGKVSEHTIGGAFLVASGLMDRPVRPEDTSYERSEALRETAWG